MQENNEAQFSKIVEKEEFLDKIIARIKNKQIPHID